MRRSTPLITIALMLTQAPRAPSQGLDGLASYQRARQSLDAAVVALGGPQALNAVQRTAFEYRGHVLARGQSAHPDAAYDVNPIEGRVVYEEGGRLLTESRTEFRGGIEFHNRFVIDADSGWFYRIPARQLTRIGSLEISLLENGPTYAPRLMPHSLVRTALARAASLRWLGKSRWEGQAVERLAFTDADGRQLTLVLDEETGRPHAAESVGPDPLHGDALFEVRFADYREVGNVQVPATLRFATAGEVLQEWAIQNPRINPESGDDTFVPPAGIEVTAYPPSFQPQELAPGVYALRLFSGFGNSYNIMFAEFDDHVVVIEMPLVDVLQRFVAGVIARVAPDKPIRYAVSSHYHVDHTGGVNAYLAAGVTVLTGPQTAEFIRRRAAAPHTINPNPVLSAGIEPAIEVVSDSTAIADNRLTLKLYNIGPTAHVDDLVIAYFPDSGVLYAPDHFGIPDNRRHPGVNAALADFVARIRELGLGVTTVVPTHGPVSTWDEVIAALERSAE